MPSYTNTTSEIKKFSTDREQSNSLLALMDYYHTDCLVKISEEQALAFLEKLKKGEVKINEV